MRLLAEGKIDALMGFPPVPQELRAKKIGHVVVNSAADRPWSQYFCCMMAGNREFVRKHPVATKRAMRAILKANQICALEPERAARLLVDKGFTTNYDYALQTMKEIPYGKWREYDPEDTVRFYSLRLHEAGHDQVEPAENHRAGNGLAVFERAEEGVESDKFVIVFVIRVRVEHEQRSRTLEIRMSNQLKNHWSRTRISQNARRSPEPELFWDSIRCARR